MSDMSGAIVPNSSQTNADDLIAGPRTIKITRVAVAGGAEQPVSISFEGDNGKPYKPCKSMCRVMVQVWGADSAKYVGQSMTIYRDPSVKWGGMEVGGIRISHMTGLDSQVSMSLTASKGKWKPFTVKPLAKQSTKAPPAAETVGDILDAMPTEQEVWAAWCKESAEKIKAFHTTDALDEWLAANTEKRQELARYNGKTAGWLAKVISDKQAAFAE